MFKEKNGKTSWTLFTYNYIQGIANGIWIFLSIFLLDIGGTSLDIGFLSFLPGLASTFMKLAWGRLGDRLGTSWRMVSTGCARAQIMILSSLSIFRVMRAPQVGGSIC